MCMWRSRRATIFARADCCSTRLVATRLSCSRAPRAARIRSLPTPSRCFARGSSVTCWWPRRGTSSVGRNIGHEQPSDPPAGVNYDMWVGPAEFVPFQKNRFHYNWHWWYNFGTGDIGNDGTHDIDYARWGLGVEGLPTTAMALGGKYSFDDDQQFPDTATCAFEWPGDGKVGNRRQLIFEMRLWSTNYPFNCDSGVEFYGSAGRMMLSKRGKLEVYADRNQRVEDPKPKEPPTLIANHQADFLDAIRTRTPAQCRRRHRPRHGRVGPPGERCRAAGPIAASRSPTRSRSSTTTRPTPCYPASIAKADTGRSRKERQS